MKIVENVRFGLRDSPAYRSGEVIAYKLTPEELEKLRKETGYMELTKEKYMELKAAGKTDKVIMEEYGLNNVNLNKLKNRWGLIGVYGKRPEKIAEKAKENAPKNDLDEILTNALSNIAERAQALNEERTAVNIIKARDQVSTPTDSPFKKIALSIAETLEKKNHDYGDSFTKLYREFGDLSAVIRLTDKLERYKSLITSEQKVNDESIEDTLMDLAGYAILTIIARKGASS